jgi:hypothetical protein
MALLVAPIAGQRGEVQLGQRLLDEPLLVLAYRPFPELQPYAETGPIFLHKNPCARYAAEEVLPPVLASSRDFIVRGYNAATYPSSVKLNNVTLAIDVDYFPSLRAGSNELWLTLNRDLSGASNRVQITP